MLILKKKNKKVWCKSRICTFEYPKISVLEYEDNKYIDEINNDIYEDITSFGDFFRENLGGSQEEFGLSNATTEYRVGFNKNNIISIAIEFSKLKGLEDISHVNTYNFDIDLKRKIVLDDIFDPKKNYLEVIRNIIVNCIEKSISENKELYEYKGINENTNRNVCKDVDALIIENLEGDEYYKNFYIDEDGIIICFSSYEIIRDVPILLESKILFKEVYDYLSEYAFCKIVKK